MNLGAPDFLFDIEILPLTFSQGQLKINYSISFKLFCHHTKYEVDQLNGWNHLELKFFQVKVLSAGHQTTFRKMIFWVQTYKKHKISWFLKKKFFFSQKWMKT